MWDLIRGDAAREGAIEAAVVGGGDGDASKFAWLLSAAVVPGVLGTGFASQFCSNLVVAMKRDRSEVRLSLDVKGRRASACSPRSPRYRLPFFSQ